MSALGHLNTSESYAQTKPASPSHSFISAPITLHGEGYARRRGAAWVVARAEMSAVLANNTVVRIANYGWCVGRRRPARISIITNGRENRLSRRTEGKGRPWTGRGCYRSVCDGHATDPFLFPVRTRGRGDPGERCDHDLLVCMGSQCAVAVSSRTDTMSTGELVLEGTCGVEYRQRCKNARKQVDGDRTSQATSSESR